MNDVQKMIFKNSFQSNTLDIKEFLKEQKIVLNLDNYKPFLDDVLKIIYEARSEMYLDDLERLYPYQKLIFNDIYREVYGQVLVNSKVRQMPKELFEDLKNYYKKFNSLAQAGALRVNLVGDIEDEKVKKIK